MLAFERRHHYITYPLDLRTEERGGRRYYITPFGKAYPSITTVLSATKQGNGALDRWRNRVGNEEAERIVRNSSERGTALHLIAENYLEGRSDFFRSEQAAQLPEDAIALWPQIKHMIDVHVTDVVATEVALYSNALRIAGRTDLIADCNGRLTIVDFKNARQPKKAEWIQDYFIQVTGYAAMHFDLTGVFIPEGRIWIGVENGQPQEFRFRTAHYIDALKDRCNRYAALSVDPDNATGVR